MIWLVVIGLGIVVWQLAERLKRLERRLEQLEWRERPAPVVVPAAMPLAQRDEPVQTAAAPPPPPPPPPPAPITARSGSHWVTGPDGRPRRATAPVSAPEPDSPAAEPAPARPARPRFDFEDLFGRRLPIWAGGVALAVAGVFLVRYSIEAGLMTPPVRVALSFVFGIMLLAGAEVAYRFEHKLADPRVRQALAGAGLATLYAAFYLAGSMYGLIGAATAFAGLAAVTALAVALTYRFGLPAAVLALVGGFATPLLVASESANVPVLTFYLALTTSGLALTGRRIGQPWLSLAALLAGFGWGALILLGELAGAFDAGSLGLYLLALGVGVPLLAAGHGQWSLPRIGAGAVAALQLAWLVDKAGYDTLTLALFLLLAAALAALSWREAQLRPGNALVAALGVVLLAIWPDPPGLRYAFTAGVFALIVLGLPLALLWRGQAKWPDLAQLSLAAPALAAAAAFQFGLADPDAFQPVLAAACAALGVAPALAAWRLWHGERQGEQQAGLPVRILAEPIAVAALLALAALHLLLPDWAQVAGAAAVALALAALAWRRREPGLLGLAWSGAVVTLAVLLAAAPAVDELARLIGESWGEPQLLHALIRWAVAGLPWLALALLHAPAWPARVAEALFAFTLYVLAAQVIPAPWLEETLAATAALFAIAGLVWQRPRAGFWGAMAGFAGLWGLAVLVVWAGAGLEALGGMAMLRADLPAAREALQWLLPVTATLALAAWLHRDAGRRGQALAVPAGALALVLAHILYKQLFAIDTPERFVALGLAERSVWQALLLGAGMALVRFVPGALRAGTALVAIGAAHGALFTLLLHNPLWSAQAVGPWPLANLLLPAFALAGVAALWLVARAPAALRPRLAVAVDGALMALALLFALATLRHAFSGSLISAAPMSQGEDLLRSLAGIVLALGFLWWGARTGTRSWRIGSLVVMLAAVAKVFLVDAAGLEGLLRIASFLALGLSLIAIGWVYARQLKGVQATPEPDAG